MRLSGFGVLVSACVARCASGVGNTVIEPHGDGGGVYGALTPDQESMVGLLSNGDLDGLRLR